MTDLRPTVSATATTVLFSASSPLDLIVVGGGPVGFMAAITAAEQGARQVLVLEERLSRCRKCASAAAVAAT